MFQICVQWWMKMVKMRMWIRKVLIGRLATVGRTQFLYISLKCEFKFSEIPAQYIVTII